MVISLQSLIEKYNMKINGVLHIGAHYGQEVNEYISCNVKKVWFFEPVKQTYDVLNIRLSEHLDKFEEIKTSNIALGNRTGKITMHIESANEGMSSSILEPNLHKAQYPHIVFNEMSTVDIDMLDNIDIDKSYNFINMDVQGYELEVLRGGRDILESIDYIYTEINRAELYTGCAYVNELDLFLSNYKFKRVETNWCGDTWGDALYINEGK